MKDKITIHPPRLSVGNVYGGSADNYEIAKQATQLIKTLQSILSQQMFDLMVKRKIIPTVGITITLPISELARTIKLDTMMNSLVFEIISVTENQDGGSDVEMLAIRYLIGSKTMSFIPEASTDD
ncbi:MAG: hypothetical protein MI810_01115 [Flavobacteriales bacterium]|nr:hypothetical protein [Flavobacteriales bacterium]